MTATYLTKAPSMGAALYALRLPGSATVVMQSARLILLAFGVDPSAIAP